MSTLPALPPGWSWAALDDLVPDDRPICYGILKPGPDVEKGVPYVKVRDIRDGKVLLDTLHHTTPEIDGQYKRSRLRAGDLLISIRGTYGRVATVPDALAGGNITQDSARLSVTGAEPSYVRWYLEGPTSVAYQRAVARGVAVKGVNIRDLRLLPVALPPRSEQLRIVAELERRLSHLDASVAGLKRAKRLIATTRSQLLDRATRATVESATCTLGELLSEPLRNGRSAPTAPGEDGVRTFTLSAVTRRSFTSQYTKIAVGVSDELASLFAKSGDIFIQRSNTPDLVGSAALYSGPDGLAIFPDLLIRIRVDRQRALPEWVELVLRAPAARRYFKECAQGLAGSMPKISQPKIMALPIAVPSLEAQASAVEKADRELSLVDAAERAIEAAIAKAEMLRRSLLRDAFAGKLVPTDSATAHAPEVFERNGDRSARRERRGLKDTA